MADILLENYHDRIATCNSLSALNDLKNTLFNKQDGVMVAATKQMATLPAEERPEYGKVVNTWKIAHQQAIARREEELSEQTLFTPIDLSLPATVGAPALAKELRSPGTMHPITQTIREITDIFAQIGFARRRYRETETDFYAFESLNMPANHPARAEWETFYLEGGCVMTPHTSNGQGRELEKGELPIRIVNISRCARRQEDVSHVPSFYQFEGLLVDKKVSIANLKGVLDYFVHSFFGPERHTRLRPYNFRFTEPSFEIDISCSACNGTGHIDAKSCRLCKEGWLELGGAGMVHPNVLKAFSLDPTQHTGFAFGWGVERVFMMKNPNTKLPDIRLLYQNDIRFLTQERVQYGY